MSDQYLEGFKAGLNEAYIFLYSKVGASDLVRDIIERFKEMQKKSVKEVEVRNEKRTGKNKRD